MHCTQPSVSCIAEKLVQGLAKFRLASIVFAKLLEDSLTSAHPETSLPVDIHTRIETALSIRSTAAASSDIDKQGTRLWNLSSKLKSISGGGDGEMLCLGKGSHSEPFLLMLTQIVRVFAFLLLDCAQRGAEGSASSAAPIIVRL